MHCKSHFRSPQEWWAFSGTIELEFIFACDARLTARNRNRRALDSR
jgi:hypothetical protein